MGIIIPLILIIIVLLLLVIGGVVWGFIGIVVFAVIVGAVIYILKRYLGGN